MRMSPKRGLKPENGGELASDFDSRFREIKVTL